MRKQVCRYVWNVEIDSYIGGRICNYILCDFTKRKDVGRKRILSPTLSPTCVIINVGDKSGGIGYT